MPKPKIATIDGSVKEGFVPDKAPLRVEYDPTFCMWVVRFDNNIAFCSTKVRAQQILDYWTD